MKNSYTQISIQEIPETTWEGYYWYSSESKPHVIKNEPIDGSIFSDMPFIIEANFYSAAENKSLQVKFIDGVYLLGLMDVSGTDLKEQRYIGHDIGCDFMIAEGVTSEEDPSLDNFEIKKPVWHAFKGFVD